MLLLHFGSFGMSRSFSVTLGFGPAPADVQCRFLLSAHVDAVQNSIFGLCTAKFRRMHLSFLRHPFPSSSVMSSSYVGVGPPGRTWTLPFILVYDSHPSSCAERERRGSQRSLVTAATAWPQSEALSQKKVLFLLVTHWTTTASTSS